MIITIPSTSQDLGVQLSKQYAAQKRKNTQALFQIFSSIKFLCRQGLSLRGDGIETDGNMQQLLTMKAKEDANLELPRKLQVNHCYYLLGPQPLLEKKTHRGLSTRLSLHPRRKDS